MCYPDVLIYSIYRYNKKRHLQFRLKTTGKCTIRQVAMVDKVFDIYINRKITLLRVLLACNSQNPRRRHKTDLWEKNLRRDRHRVYESLYNIGTTVQWCTCVVISLMSTRSFKTMRYLKTPFSLGGGSDSHATGSPHRLLGSLTRTNGFSYYSFGAQSVATCRAKTYVCVPCCPSVFLVYLSTGGLPISYAAISSHIYSP